jgi:3-methyladenine DNA glycosylase AlkD
MQRALEAAADPGRAAALARFFKTGPGQYGEGDRFLGLTVPQIRRMAPAFREVPLVEIDRLLASPWHEARLLALILLVAKYGRAGAPRRREIFDLYLRRTDRINNWDLVDASAPQIVGAHLMTRSRRTLHTLARSSSVWERRIAVVATLWFIRHGQYDDMLTLAGTLADDRHDLIHKASGWMLREIGKRDEAVLRSFLDRHAGFLPRTTLRYAIERFPPATRRRYLAQPRNRR